MSTNREEEGPAERGGVAFLLSQLGMYATGRFAERIAGLDLTPPQAGLLRELARTPGRSQRELADDLGMLPSRFVPFADELEERGLIERRRSTRDRRLYELHLTKQGTDLLAELREAAAAHEQQLCRSLSDEEHRQLGDLLRRVADQQELKPGVHPGYQWMQGKRPRSKGGAPKPDGSE